MASATPDRLIWGGRSHPHGHWGWSGYPQWPKLKKKKKKIKNKKINKLLAVEGGRTTPKGHGVAEATHRLAGAIRPPLMGWLATLGFLKIFFNLLLF
jgi:hypothetical protein